MPEPSEPKTVELAPQPPEISAPPVPEAGVEVAAEAPEAAPVIQEKKGAVEKTVEGVKHIIHRPKKPTAVPVVRDALSIQVEKIMEEDLADAYKALPPVTQQEFKLAGERTAYAIRELLQKTHVKIKKIFKLLLAWLLLLPGVNRYFLEQEAKIKADKILALKYRR
jgi:HSP90 family molecular chaperone